MVCDKPDMPEGPGLNPQSCDIDYSQSREWGHQGCLGHFQGDQEGHFQITGGPGGSSWCSSTISVLWTFLLWNLLMASVL